MKIENLRVPQDCGYMILPDGKYYSLNDRKTYLNNNVLVVGTTGAAKTRTMVTPNLLEAYSSYVVTDPKGNLYRKWGGEMEKKGYRVVRLSFIHPEYSAHYNPLMYLHTSQDIQTIAGALTPGNFHEDPFWTYTSRMLLSSLIGCLKERADYEIRHGITPKEAYSSLVFQNVLRLLEFGKQKSDYDPDSASALKTLMEQHEEIIPGSWAAKQFRQLSVAADRTWNSIAISAVSELSTFDTLELKKMMRKDDLDLASIGQRRTAVFVEVSDTDRSMDRLINLFFTQAMHELCTYADEKCPSHQLPVPVRFIMDDFATNCRIDNFGNMISNIRSRKISAIIVLQSLKQLVHGYGENASTIADDCDTLIYMGGNDPETAYSIALRVDRTTSTILHMEVGTSWIMRRGEKPYNCRNFDLDDYIRAKAGGKKLLTEENREKEC